MTEPLTQEEQDEFWGLMARPIGNPLSTHTNENGEEYVDFHVLRSEWTQDELKEIVASMEREKRDELFRGIRELPELDS